MSAFAYPFTGKSLRLSGVSSRSAVYWPQAFSRRDFRVTAPAGSVQGHPAGFDAEAHASNSAQSSGPLLVNMRPSKNSLRNPDGSDFAADLSEAEQSGRSLVSDASNSVANAFVQSPHLVFAQLPNEQTRHAFDEFFICKIVVRNLHFQPFVNRLTLQKSRSVNRPCLPVRRGRGYSYAPGPGNSVCVRPFVSETPPYSRSSARTLWPHSR